MISRKRWFNTIKKQRRREKYYGYESYIYRNSGSPCGCFMCKGPRVNNNEPTLQMMKSDESHVLKLMQ